MSGRSKRMGFVRWMVAVACVLALATTPPAGARAGLHNDILSIVRRHRDSTLNQTGLDQSRPRSIGERHRHLVGNFLPGQKSGC